MRLDILNEKHYSGPLYHATMLTAAIHIMRKGEFRMARNHDYVDKSSTAWKDMTSVHPVHDRSKIRKSNQYRFQMSFAREKTNSYRYKREDRGDGSGHRFMLEYNVMFVLDPAGLQNKKNLYVEPYNYFHVNHDLKKSGYFESEEGIFSTEQYLPIDGLIRECHVLKDDWFNIAHSEDKRDQEPRINKLLIEMLKSAKDYNVALYAYDMTMKNDFVMLNKKKAERLA